MSAGDLEWTNDSDFVALVREFETQLTLFRDLSSMENCDPQFRDEAEAALLNARTQLYDRLVDAFRNGDDVDENLWNTVVDLGDELGIASVGRTPTSLPDSGSAPSSPPASNPPTVEVDLRTPLEEMSPGGPGDGVQEFSLDTPPKKKKKKKRRPVSASLRVVTMGLEDIPDPMAFQDAFVNLVSKSLNCPPERISVTGIQR